MGIEPGWVLWSGTVGLESPLEGRVRAARAGRYARLSLSPLDVERSGRPATELGRELRDEGLELVLDPSMNWHDGAPRPGSRFGRVPVEQALQVAQDLGVVALTVIAHASTDLSPAALGEAFGDVCDAAAGWGAQVHLEFMPMSAVTDLAGAWKVVAAADRPNGGIAFDTWHFFRGTPDLAVIAQVPGNRIFTVQVDDALAEPQGSLREDTQHRLLPGDGQLDLAGVLRALDRTGGLSWVGPEVISPQTAAMPPEEAALLARERVEQVLADARATA